VKTITPHLWFDNQAREAGRFYASLFPSAGGTPEQVQAVTQTSREMKKFDLEDLEEAFAGGKAGARQLLDP